MSSASYECVLSIMLFGLKIFQMLPLEITFANVLLFEQE